MLQIAWQCDIRRLCGLAVVICLLAGGTLCLPPQLRCAIASGSLFGDSTDSLRSDTIGRRALQIERSGELLFSLIGFAAGVNVDYPLFKSGEYAGVFAGARGFLGYQYLANVLAPGGTAAASIGVNLQVGGYVGNFAANFGAGVGMIGSETNEEMTGGVTGVSGEFQLGSRPGFAMVLTGRLFVKDWSRYLLLTDNAAGYGGIGVRHTW
jgi:hypothetical protein